MMQEPEKSDQQPKENEKETRDQNETGETKLDKQTDQIMSEAGKKQTGKKLEHEPSRLNTIRLSQVGELTEVANQSLIQASIQQENSSPNSKIKPREGFRKSPSLRKSSQISTGKTMLK